MERKVGQPVEVEVAHPNSMFLSILINFLHRSPCAIYITEGLVHQIEVNIFLPQPIQRAVKGFNRGFVPVILYSQLRSNENFLARDTTALNGVTYCLLASVSGGGINPAIPRHESIVDTFLRFFICFSGRRPISNLKNLYGMNAVSTERKQSTVTFSKKDL